MTKWAFLIACCVTFASSVHSMDYLAYPKIEAKIKAAESSEQKQEALVALLKYAVNPHEGEQMRIVEAVPVMQHILKSKDPTFTPVLLAYAAKTEDIYLRRRAVYLVEKLEKKSIGDILEKSEKISDDDCEKMTSAIPGDKEKLSHYFAPEGRQYDFLDEAVKRKS